MKTSLRFIIALTCVFSLASCAKETASISPMYYTDGFFRCQIMPITQICMEDINWDYKSFPVLDQNYYPEGFAFLESWTGGQVEHFKIPTLFGLNGGTYRFVGMDWNKVMGEVNEAKTIEIGKLPEISGDYAYEPYMVPPSLFRNDWARYYPNVRFPNLESLSFEGMANFSPNFFFLPDEEGDKAPNLRKIHFGDGLLAIRTYMDSYLGPRDPRVLPSWKEVTFPSTLMEFRDTALLRTHLERVNVVPGNPYFDSYEGNLYSEGYKELIFHPPYGEKTLVLPKETRFIRYAGYFDTYLERLVLPKNYSFDPETTSFGATLAESLEVFTHFSEEECAVVAEKSNEKVILHAEGTWELVDGLPVLL